MKDSKMLAGYASLRDTGRMISLTLSGAIYLLFLFITGCKSPETGKLEVLKLYGNDEAGNISRSFIFHSTTCHITRPGAFMAADGDLMWLGEWMVVNGPELKSKDGAIHFVSSDSLLLINGAIKGLSLTGEPYPLPDTNAQDILRQLHVIKLTPEGFQKNQGWVSALAKLNPKCNLILEEPLDSNQLRWLFDRFDPIALRLDTPEEFEYILGSEKSLRHLFLENDDSAYAGNALPPMPSLHTLIAMFDGDGFSPEMKTGNWLKNNPQIKFLTINSWDSAVGLEILKNLTAPEYLIGAEINGNRQAILQHKASLQRVFIDDPEVQYQLPNAKWITIMNDSLTQQDINLLIKEKPDCEILEIYANGDPLDVTPLQSLKNLKALTIVDGDSINTDPLKQMKQLKMLSFSYGENNTDSVVAILQAALPNTVVVANEGLCLGSGWLLLSIPALLGAIMLANKKRKMRALS